MKNKKLNEKTNNISGREYNNEKIIMEKTIRKCLDTHKKILARNNSDNKNNEHTR